MRDSFEIINRGQVTPHRLHALVRLVTRLRKPSRERILDYLQPKYISANQESAASVYSAARNLSLIEEVNGSKGETIIHPSITSASMIEGVDGFRLLLQDRLLGKTDPEGDNYLLNLVAAWYAVQDSTVLKFTKQDVSTNFNQSLFPSETRDSIVEGRAFNNTKLNAWLVWASFLGWGWIHNDKFMPVADQRIRSVIGAFSGKTIPFATFARTISEECPELDGGVLFEKCWSACRSEPMQAHHLSLIFSTALRVLHDLNEISLWREADANDIWHLHVAQGHQIQEVSHIEIK